MAVIPPFFLDCIVAIGFPDAEGNHQYAATGFIYGHFVQQIGDNKEYKTFLVTNRHVVQNMPKAYLRFNPEGTDPAREYDLNLLDESRNPLWLSHSNPDIDIAVVAINASLLREHHISFNWFQSDAHAATRA